MTGRPTGVEPTACPRHGNWAHSNSIRDETEFPAMPAPKPSITRAEFDVLAARTGLPLDEAQKSECYAVFGYLEEIAARVRVDGNRPREAEPALIFHAGRRKGGA
jgi:hypothetical protein